jgi:hypothetical protein
MKKEPERRLHLLRIAQMLRDELRSRGFNVLPGETAIVPVVIRELDLPPVQDAARRRNLHQSVLRPAARRICCASPAGGAHRESVMERLVSPWCGSPATRHRALRGAGNRSCGRGSDFSASPASLSAGGGIPLPLQRSRCRFSVMVGGVEFHAGGGGQVKRTPSPPRFL